ncbi:hypothetical protein [Pseudonocardia sp. HH130630-07]|uniref:hypothetical protein n=1 Tax=Pseudonocardia sp. HH130630-07 TaxID=1690815 RepID=UPI000814CE3F|nr:hypothetical protein [Pseudonocardia sp. HH130630-07]ANY07767.1 hypothetical protein AFB00_17345 [Pseudonocardia sp. HH130630-07]
MAGCHPVARTNQGATASATSVPVGAVPSSAPVTAARTPAGSRYMTSPSATTSRGRPLGTDSHHPGSVTEAAIVATPSRSGYRRLRSATTDS